MHYKEHAQAHLSEIISRYKSSLTQGLSSQDAQQRRTEYGENSISTSNRTLLTIIMRQLASPFTYLLIAAALLSLVLSDVINAVVIGCIILLNLILCVIQEYRAEKTIRLLQKYLSLSTRVLRDGVETVIESTQLVPGDIVILQPGDPIPADLRILEAQQLTINESSLTGESEPELKQADPLTPTSETPYPANCAFMGTFVASGSGKALVIATGNSTVFGSLSELTLSTQQQSMFQKHIGQLSNFLIKLVGVTLIAMIIAHVLVHGSATDVGSLIIFSITLAVAVTPEALPVVMTWSLSRGALALAKQHVIVKRLTSIEDLGSITVLCTDKTGTLTENTLTVVATHSINNRDPLELALLTTLSKHQSSFTQAFKQTDAYRTCPRAEYTILEDIPFDPHSRKATLVLQTPTKTTLVISLGAAEELFGQCALTAEEQQSSEAWIHEQGSQARRTVALAFKEYQKDALYSLQDPLTLAGIVALEDPLKKTAQYAIDRAQQLGIAVKIITGDSKEVAAALSLKVGLITSPNQVILGSDFEKLSEQKKALAVEKYAVFARILPQQKHEIIELLKKNHAVGFIGEGINDAPALKSAHVGIVVQGGTDIAREAGDIILMRKSLAVIIDGIALGRTTFTNTIKYIMVCLTSSFGSFYSISIASLFLDYLPMLPLQLLLINFLSDIPMMAIATDHVDAGELHSPKTYRVRDLTFSATIFAALSSIFDFILFARFFSAPPPVLHTHWFILSILAQFCCIFSLRSHKPFFRAIPPSRPLVILAALVSVVVLALPYTRLGEQYLLFVHPTAHSLLFIFGLLCTYFTANELVKYVYFSWWHRATTSSL